jgi:hypothetical protein
VFKNDQKKFLNILNRELICSSCLEFSVGYLCLPLTRYLPRLSHRPTFCTVPHYSSAGVSEEAFNFKERPREKQICIIIYSDVGKFAIISNISELVHRLGYLAFTEKSRVVSVLISSSVRSIKLTSYQRFPDSEEIMFLHFAIFETVWTITNLERRGKRVNEFLISYNGSSYQPKAFQSTLSCLRFLITGNREVLIGKRSTNAGAAVGNFYPSRYTALSDDSFNIRQHYLAVTISFNE